MFREAISKATNPTFLATSAVLLATDIGAGLVLYNFGKGGGKQVSLSLPPRTELWNMAKVASVTSILTGALIATVENWIGADIDISETFAASEIDTSPF
jgi:ATP/ADP translocase